MLTPDYQSPNKVEPEQWKPARPLTPTILSLKITADLIAFVLSGFMVLVIGWGIFEYFPRGAGLAICPATIVLPVPAYIVLSRYRSDGLDTALMRINAFLLGVVAAVVLVTIGLVVAFAT